MKKSSIVFLTIIITITLFYYCNIAQYITIDGLKYYRYQLEDFIDHHYIISVISYILVYSIISGLPVPGDSVLTIAGGFFYGILPAMLYANIAITLGAVYVYLVFKYIIKIRLSNKKNRYKHKFDRVVNGLRMHNVNTLLALRLIPMLPAFTVNIMGGLSNIDLFTFVWTTSIGIIPISFFYALAGKNLSKISSAGDALSWPILLSLLALATIVLLPIVIRKKKH